MFNRFVFLILSLFILSSCVGVIQDNNRAKTTSITDKGSMKFAGIYDGHGISHNKIVLRFLPAKGTGQFVYHAFLNDSPNPIAAVAAENTVLDSQGYINLIVKDGLEFNQAYYFNVKVKDVNKGIYDTNTVFKQIWTMNSFVPDFDGISSIKNLNGVDSMTKLNITWNQAQVPTVTAGDPFSIEHAISGYNIYVSSSLPELSNILNESNQHTIDASKYPNSKILSVSTAETESTEKVVSGLNPGTLYYAAVRARQSSSPPQYELNTKIISLKTLTSAPVEFAGITSASVPSTFLGFSQIDVSWLPATGADRYKIYVKPLSLDSGSIHPFFDSTYLIKTVTNLTTTSTSLLDGTKISASTSYAVYIIACKDSTCGWNGASLNTNEVKGTSIKRTIKTIPPIAPFSESDLDSIITITQPSGVAGLTSLNVNWSSIDLTRGYYSEVRIYQVLDKNLPYKDLTSINLREVPYNRPNVNYAHPYINPSVTPALLVANTPVTARIINLTMGQEYCFIALPVIANNGLPAGEIVTLTGSSWPTVQCKTPQYVAPTFGASSLLPVCNPSADGSSANITWTAPTDPGIMTYWEIWYRKGPSSFEFSGANGAWLNGLGTYTKDPSGGLVLANVYTTTIEGLIPSTQYIFGVNSFYQPSVGSPIRTVPSLPMATVSCQTPEPTVEHGDWVNIQAIGPKITNTGITIPEKMTTDWKMAVYDAAGTSHGMVRLAWLDFLIAGSSLKVYDFYSPGNENFVGYHVYRMKVTTEDDITDAEDPNNLKWDTSNTNVSLLDFEIIEENGQKYAYSGTGNETTNLISVNTKFSWKGSNAFEFVDYVPEHGKIYMYKVVAVFNGIETEFANPLEARNVIKIHVPHANETFMHRWAANIQTCGDLYRGVGTQCRADNLLAGKCSDPDNNYRCEFAGKGSVDETGVLWNQGPSGTMYYDLGRSVIFDRYLMGCNYTRYTGPGTGCTVGGVPNRDCIGPNATTVPTNGAAVAVMLDSASGSCYTRRAGGVGGWLNSTALNISTEIKYNATFPTTSGLGRILGSNAAMLQPQSGNHNQPSANAICSDQQVAPFYAGDATVYTKRLNSRKEIMPAGSWNDFILPSVAYTKIEISNTALFPDKVESGCANETALKAKTNWANYNPAYAPMTNQILGGYAAYFLKTGSYGNYSTEKCQSKFGLQDHISYLDSISLEQLYKPVGLPMIGTVPNHEPTFKDYEGIVFDNSEAASGTFWMSGRPYSIALGISLKCTTNCDPDDLVYDFNAADRLSLGNIGINDWTGYDASVIAAAVNNEKYPFTGSVVGGQIGRFSLYINALFEGTALGHPYRCAYHVDHEFH